MGSEKLDSGHPREPIFSQNPQNRAFTAKIAIYEKCLEHCLSMLSACSKHTLVGR